MMRFTKAALAVVMLLIFAVPSLMADEVYARVKGTIVDTTGALIPTVQLTATNTQTGVSKTITSRSDGTYEFVQLPVGPYTIAATKSGFKNYKSNIVLTVNENFDLPIKLEVGSNTETVEVNASSVQVEKTSMQHESLVNGQQIVDLPLNGRNFTSLELLAPGVMSSNDRFGTFSVNGSQTQQSNYLINGQDVNDIPLNTPQILPSPDAIQEFNLVSSTLDPEYGRNSGGVVNALIKNGTNSFHGDAFDFYRDNFLNARSFFSPVNKGPVFHQNQFGGTIGGPIFKNKTFFFLSYQGTYRDAGSGTGAPVSTTVFSQAQRGGLFPDITTKGGSSPVPLLDFAGVLQPPGTPYATLFPTGQINPADFNTQSVALMNKFVPLPNAANNAFAFNAINTLKANQGIMRIDQNLTQNDVLWGSYMIQDAPATSALPFIGATLPGFGEVDTARINDATIDWSHTFNSSTINEARVSYARFNFGAVNPANPASPASFGFPAITPQNQVGESMPFVGVTGFFSLGFSQDGPQPRKDQDYQFADNFSKIIGKHSLKFGVHITRFQVDNPFFFQNNGAFAFDGQQAFSTGDPGADFLLGFPDTYAQNSGGVINARAYEYYSYFQDQWKVRNNLTLTLGTGYDIETPYNNNQFGGEDLICFIPGQQSTIFPASSSNPAIGAPVGINYPGDHGCSKSGTKTHYDHIAPRVGFAWSPNLGAISGSSNKFSVRGGFGVYFNRTEEEGSLQNLGNPPFGIASFGNPNAPQIGFPNPFVDPTGSSATAANPFPFSAFPKVGQAVDFTQPGFEPLVVNVINPNYTTPYAMNFNLTLQREFPGNTVVSLGYVGSLGRHLQRDYEANQITAAGQAACKIDPVCVANANLQNFFFPSHLLDPAVIPSGPNAGGAAIPSVGQQTTDGTSNYNALQFNVTKGMTHGLQMTASYTWSHAIDNGSGFEDSGFGGRGINPFVPALDVGDSSYDARQRLVISPIYQIPNLHNQFHWAPSPIFGGWMLSSIISFQSGFPVNIFTSSSRSLFCSQAIFFYACPDNPNQIAPVQLSNPKTTFINGPNGPVGDFYFNPSAFANVPKCKFVAGVLTNGNVCGQFGNVARNSMIGPGFANFDMAFVKNTKIGERVSLETGLEAFNLFNHTNFLFGGVGGTQDQSGNANVNSGNFGRVTSSYPGRILQIRAKVNF